MRSHTVARSEEPDLHVVETGPRDAQSLLFVHGYSQSHLSWREQLRSPLADEFHLVAMDLRGHGDSEKPHEGYGDSENWADDVRAVVKTLGLEPFILIGWSYGSLVALDYLSNVGTDGVAGVNLISTVAGIGTDRTNGWLQAEYLELFPDLVSTDAETSMSALQRFVELCFEGELSAEDRYLLFGTSATVPPYVRDGMRDRTVSHVESFEGLSVPVLLTHGTHDDVVSMDASREAHRRMPEYTLSEFPDSGHAPHWESPERYKQELREFVADLRESTTPSER
ncbi:MAG TPA: alpha/beta hydrolase [Halococcus sp.]|nr:alpha/beta hydrolase [Halococcus sp.]